MKLFNQAKRYGAKVCVFASGAMLLAAPVMAAVPAAVSDAIDDYAADGLTVATAVLAGFIVIWTVKALRRSL